MDFRRPSPSGRMSSTTAARSSSTTRSPRGAGACANCLKEMGWGLCSVKVSGTDSYELLVEVLPDGNQCLSWQMHSLACGEGTCSGGLPARGSTWGQIRSLYR
jgi:hypothetical protein